MKKQSGVIALMTTSLLLVVALVVTMGAYKTSLYEIKRAQNEVESRKNYWKAEGLLECTLGYLRSSGEGVDVLEDTASRPEDFTAGCIANRGNISLVVSKGTDYVLTATSNTSTLTRAMVNGVSQPKGAIQVSGDLEMVGTVTITPSVGAKVAGELEEKYECTSVRFSDSFTFRYDSVQGFDQLEYGYSTSSLNADKNCHDDYVTALGKDSAAVSIDASNPMGSPAFAKDFLPDTKMDLFRELFGVSGNKQNVATISGNSEMFVKKVVSGSDCGTLISNHFSSTEKLGLWLVGNCEISGAVNETGTQGQMLVIENGAFALFGAFAFNGLVYHKVDSTDKSVSSSIKNFWQKKRDTETVYKPYITNDTVGVQFYSSAPNGGLIIDTKGGRSTLVGDMNLNFNAGYRPTFLKGAYTWKKGAWRDF
ncbi:hypothetical protein [Vibrio sp. 10N]|uniref:hypothetical protein n=1 Tax=Vibrio sp. 10N TaxID=3058938 RepID=UPI002813BFEB|nr:hypothetical protein VB10N_06570 [Vibrio sp. 10N]